MNLKWLTPLLFAATLMAQESLVRIYTLELQADEKKIQAQPRVVVEYEDYYIECDRAVYDKSSKIVRLYGDIFILSEKGFGTYGDFALFDLQSKKVISKPFFLEDSASLLWVAGSTLDAKEQKIQLQNSYISSCDINRSDWRIFFERGEFDRKNNWVNLYNIKFYAKEYPILYLPYLGFSTLKKRHTGLLRPKLGISSREGFIYIQPIYFAPENWWDLELDPQIRTDRGQGLYGTFRFVDSPYSFGKITAGYFDEFPGSVEKFELKNDLHYGADIFYKRYRLFTDYDDNSSHDGVFVDGKIYNDVDYYNLQKTELIEGINSIVTSRFNYYYDKNDNYFGIYAKYFKDNRKADNSDTLQLLPTLQYHKYYETIFVPELYYNVDFTVSHYYREVGLNALEYRLDLPIKFNYTFFDDLLGFTISENLFAEYADYNFVDKHLNKKWQNSYIYRNTHEISFYSDLIKPYESFTHTLHLDATFNIPSYEKKRGDQAPFINIEDQSKRVDLSLKHYFYDSAGKELWYHRLMQPIEYEEDERLGDLENEVGVWFGEELLLNNYLFYSHRRDTLVSSVTTLSYTDEKNDLFLSHFYKNRVEGERDSNFVRFQMQRDLSKKYKLFATIDFDIKDENALNWSVGWRMKKSCWSYEIRFQKEVVPLLTQQGSDSYENRTVYFRIELFPLGGISKSIRSVQRQRIF